MSPTVQAILSIVCALIASGGFWTLVQKRVDKNSAHAQMLIGLGHDRIMFLGMNYIERGWITKDEYENLYTYLYVPYVKLGGNGSAKRIMEEVNNLPIRN